jgi:DNA-directed RNA polymerase specialized sigma24 family protein
VPLPPFQALLDAHGRDVHRFLTASVGPVEADDCYQETWLAALRAYPRLRDASNLRGWILTVAHRKAIDHHRARVRRPVPVGGPEAAASVASGSPSAAVAPGSPSAAVAPPPLPRDGSGLWAQVAALPAKQRTALALRFVADLPYDEIGAVMHTSGEAARRNVYEALTRLRKDYGHP